MRTKVYIVYGHGDYEYQNFYYPLNGLEFHSRKVNCRNGIFIYSRNAVRIS